MFMFKYGERTQALCGDFVEGHVSPDQSLMYFSATGVAWGARKAFV